MVSSSAAPAAAPARRGSLLQVMGVAFGIAMTVGNSIAGGILRTPGEVAAYLPRTALFLGVWIAGGNYALIGTISLTELGAMVPRAGGQYVFARRAIGPYAGFIIGWSDWLSTCGTNSAISILVGEYLGKVLPAVQGHAPSIAVAIIVAFALLQWGGARQGARAQEITSLVKGLVFLVMVGGCFLLGGGVKAATPGPPLQSTGMPLYVAVILALQAVVYTYDGWNGPIYFSEEMKDPGREIPRAMFGGVISVMVIYLLFNAALVYVLPIQVIAGNNFAMGRAANAIIGPHGEQLILGLMIVSLLSACNAYPLMASRVLYAMSRDSLVSRRATQVNAGGTPTISLLAGTIIAIAFIATGTFEAIIEMLAYFFVAQYTMSYISLFVLRRRQPQTPRPYRAWGYPVTTGIALVGAVAFLVAAIVADLKDTTAVRHYSIYALGLLILSYPAYRLLRREGFEKEGD
jgi:APA family basic amino acid/polyamine antiporter